ncbi:MAG: nucleoside-diphosphate sugar epimerase/dehydratase [Pseudomonadota bacterium]
MAMKAFYRIAFVKKIIEWTVVARFWVTLVFHVILFTTGYFYSICLINGGSIDSIVWHTFARTIMFLLVIRIGVFMYHDLFQGMWRYVGFEDLTNIIRAAIIGTLLFYILGLLVDYLTVSEHLYLAEMVFCITLNGGVRFLVRSLRERYFKQARPHGEIKKILLFGPVLKTQPLLKELLSNAESDYRPVALIDPEIKTTSRASRVSDIPVWGVQQLRTLKKKYSGIHAIVLCWPGATQTQMDKAVDELKLFQVPFKTIPQIEDLLTERVTISDIREVEIEDLLERPPVNIDMAEIEKYLCRKTVLITGGGGSIGSEICRQVASYQPCKIVVVERSENSLYDLQLQMRERFPNVPFHGLVSSINDAIGMEKIVKEMAVEVIFHAAAYKHVPLMEHTPIESAYNNIIGTYNVARAAMMAGVRRFVMISTDKAVNPSNVMGVTKRIAEMIVQGLNQQGKTRFITVRFGNVLGSAGSVIPIFKRQIKEGRCITVTHPEIERFFMTIPEAVQLVLQAGCMGDGGEIFVLDMGAPVKILKLAEKMITLSGKRPYEEIDIKFTGLRPGEKMYEELFNTNERHTETLHPRIRAAVSSPLEEAFIHRQIPAIKALIEKRDNIALRDKFLELVPTYCTPPEPVQVKGEPGPEEYGEMNKQGRFEVERESVIPKKLREAIRA